MKIDNAARKPQAAEVHRGLHLVHSRDWSENVRHDNTGQQTPRRAQMPPQIGESHTLANVGLAAAALVAPLVWLGHAVLRWKHVL